MLKEKKDKEKNIYMIPKILKSSKSKSILKKPKWLKIKLPSNLKKINKIKKILKKNFLHSVCEEANCPNLPECFNNGTATFMILGSICTRKCPFCAVTKGRAQKIDKNEPKKILDIVIKLKLTYVVLTSVARDDLKDGGAKHFSKCIYEIRKKKNIKVEILVPDFRGKEKIALKIFNKFPPDIFNHNIENVPRLYSLIRPGADYIKSLNLLYQFKKICPNIPTKSGLMLGLGEKKKEIISVLKDLKSVGVSIVTIGQYLQPSKNHLLVQKYITPKEFKNFEYIALSLGFSKVFCGPLVRSSYHADRQYLSF
ncbi:lipoyl synthase [Buchnera aphidicola]|uniref:Lipoyl synthase n=1 Tax=Buchnera aphidicola subsp. Cinara cedri (strain Cc) TaxID=372461 RepID=LIPA_BUCCC|nr:lipoyl synthase [Buchnera aphidicola]Q057Q7.1 RecName: Full=Lipoyl synthase; AltName: Full=Lip-syn; Short=LS; AltName: Full=Lipoate synthase; AltName: Full=Lipoic acid synthase; AltName: Full=Sulfur insertion protein LipA [Buchnera aphidicola BCc]ABJ90642.1 lipoic acid synthetase (FeS enzyme) [Buchnera aphidicola BCc]